MAANNGVGEIRSDTLYTAREFCRRTGLSHRHLRETVPTRRIVGRRWVLGRDFIEHLPAADPPSGSNLAPSQREVRAREPPGDPIASEPES